MKRKEKKRNLIYSLLFGLLIRIGEKCNFSLKLKDENIFYTLDSLRILILVRYLTVIHEQSVDYFYSFLA